MSVAVEEVDGAVTVQGAPRWGRRHFGIPEGGAWDTEALRVANARVGNDLHSPVLELSLARLKFRVLRAVRISIAGAPTVCRIGANRYQAAESLSVKEGEEVVLEVPATFARVYVAFEDGLDPNLAGHTIRPGALLAAAANAHSPRGGLDLGYEPTPPRIIELHPFGDQAPPAALLEEVFEVSIRSNRMGIRLAGPILSPREEILSEPVCHGTVQLDNSGSLIILGPDGPTIGGYPKVGVVASHHLRHLAQLRPGSKIRFGVVATSNM